MPRKKLLLFYHCNDFLFSHSSSSSSGLQMIPHMYVAAAVYKLTDKLRARTRGYTTQPSSQPARHRFESSSSSVLCFAHSLMLMSEWHAPKIREDICVCVRTRGCVPCIWCGFGARQTRVLRAHRMSSINRKYTQPSRHKPMFRQTSIAQYADVKRINIHALIPYVVCTCGGLILLSVCVKADHRGIL